MRKQVPVPLKHIETPFMAVGRKVFDFHSSLIFIADTEANAQFIVQSCNRAPAFEAMKKALEMVRDSIFQDCDGEWELSRPAELLKAIAKETLALANKTGE